MGFFDKVSNLFKSSSQEQREALIEDYEDIFLESDFGASIAYNLTNTLFDRAKKEKVTSELGLKRIIKEELSSYIEEYKCNIQKGKGNLILLLGVNGSGKTTTAAKLANYYKKQGKKVMLAASDTFRAAAISQIKIHAKNLDVDVAAIDNAGNPAAVIYDALDNMQKKQTDIIVADTAGRLHTKENLIREMQKIDKIVHARIDKNSYIKLLVLDGTTGQNLYSQAESFDKSLGVDAIVLTKLDSGAKGGTVLRITKELCLPVAFICTGEGYDDIMEFNKEEFLERLLS